MSSRKTNRIIIGGIVVAVLALIIAAAWQKNEPAKASPLAGMTAVVYRSPTCGCCENYIRYLRGYDIKVEERLENDMDRVLREHNIPRSLYSCHTVEIGGYTVEGHIPIEAIEKLMAEKPSVPGIGMGGMPSGSPGMPGAKRGLFEIYSFSESGSTSLFVTL